MALSKNLDGRVPARTFALARLFSTSLAALASACVSPAPSDAAEGEGEDACPLGRVVATAGADVDVDACVTALTVLDGRELRILLDDVFDLRVIAEVPLELPSDGGALVLGDANSSTTASFDNGEHLWLISDGFILGMPVGVAETTLTAIDGETLHGAFDGTAFDNSLGEELVDPMFVRVTF